jgi:Tat protein translocase TatB subunit
VFLFIFESIGTSELIVIAVVALMFLGPRKLPQIAKTIGKTMADFRSTANEFKATWEKEVDFEEEAEALRTGEIRESTPTVAREVPTILPAENSILAPSIKEIDKEAFDNLTATKSEPETKAEEKADAADSLSDKRTWL